MAIMENKISTIKCYKSNFEIFLNDGSCLSLQYDEYRNENDRPCKETDARTILKDWYGIVDEDADKVILDMYIHEWIVGDDEIYMFKVNTYEAYRADEKGVRWMTNCPHDTEYYKHEVLDERFVHLPKGFAYDADYDTFYKGNVNYDLVTEKDGSVELVSADGIIKWF